jgi:hypothetical protein
MHLENAEAGRRATGATHTELQQPSSAPRDATPGPARLRARWSWSTALALLHVSRALSALGRRRARRWGDTRAQAQRLAHAALRSAHGKRGILTLLRALGAAHRSHPGNPARHAVPRPGRRPALGRSHRGNPAAAAPRAHQHTDAAAGAPPPQQPVCSAQCMRSRHARDGQARAASGARARHLA